LLITDGQVGNESEVLRWVQQHAKGVRICPVGVDQAVNAGLLQQLAEVTGGVFTLVESEKALDRAMDGLRQRIGRPLITDLKVVLPGVGPDMVGPRELFAGACTRLFGRSAGELPATFAVTGVAADGTAFRRQVPVTRVAGGSIAKMWARARVLELEHGFLAGWNEAACQPAAIAAFALQHGVLCRFTAFVAIDEVRRVPGPARQVTQAVSTPQGWGEAELADDGAYNMLSMADAECGMAAPAFELCEEAAPPPAPAARRMEKQAKRSAPPPSGPGHAGPTLGAASTPPSAKAEGGLADSALGGGGPGEAARGGGGALFLRAPQPPASASAPQRPAGAPVPPPAPALTSAAGDQSQAQAAPPAQPVDGVQRALEALRQAGTAAELVAALRALAAAVAQVTGQDAAAVLAGFDGPWLARQAGRSTHEAFVAEVEGLVQRLLGLPPSRRGGFWL
jgi:Ca-activated chloride channel family protein